MTEIRKQLKQMFCKTFDLPIKIYDEPYFMDRLTLFDPFFDTLTKYKLFRDELPKETMYQYITEYKALQECILADIWKNPAYQTFIHMDISPYKLPRSSTQNIPSKALYTDDNNGRYFISIDMRKANFTALRHFDPKIFNNKPSWEDFIRQYTDKIHWIKSKHLRKVITKHTNPKRQITYEKFLMCQILKDIINLADTLETHVSLDNIVFFSNDEIVIDVTDLSPNERIKMQRTLFVHSLTYPIAVRVQSFRLNKINGTNGYIKTIKSESADDYEFKGLTSYEYPFVLRLLLNQEPKPSDYVLYHKNRLVKLMETPDIRI